MSADQEMGRGSAEYAAMERSLPRNNRPQYKLGWMAARDFYLTALVAALAREREYLAQCGGDGPRVPCCSGCGDEKVIRTHMVEGPVGPIYCPGCEPEEGR